MDLPSFQNSFDNICSNEPIEQYFYDDNDNDVPNLTLGPYLCDNNDYMLPVDEEDERKRLYLLPSYLEEEITEFKFRKLEVEAVLYIYKSPLIRFLGFKKKRIPTPTPNF